MTHQPQLSDPVKDVAGSPRPNVQPGSRFASTTDTAGPFDARSTTSAIDARGRTIYFDDAVMDGEYVWVDNLRKVVRYDPNAPDWFVEDE